MTTFAQWLLVSLQVLTLCHVGWSRALLEPEIRSLFPEDSPSDGAVSRSRQSIPEGNFGMRSQVSSLEAVLRDFRSGEKVPFINE